MPHEIHVSERRSYRGCRRRWNWAYREGFVPEGRQKHLDFGVAYHAALESFYDPELWESTSAEEKLARAQQVYMDKCIEQRDKLLKSLGIRELPEQETETFDVQLDIGMGMLDYLANFVHPKFDDWLKPVAVEIPFVVPIQHPDLPYKSPLKCTNSPECGQSHSNDISSDDSDVVYAGRVDMLVEDKRYGGYYIWDHKTAGALTKDDGFLLLDDQIASYCWALSLILGLDIKGFAYVEYRKEYPKPPIMLKRSRNGCNFSTSKTQPTSIDVFEPYVKKMDPTAYEEGCYNEFLAWLRGAEATQYHQRFIIQKTDRELHEIGKNIALEAIEMVDPNLRIYPSVGRFTCGNCAFRQPCLGTFMGEDIDYLLESEFIQTNRRYWMDLPPSSDKAGK